MTSGRHIDPNRLAPLLHERFDLSFGNRAWVDVPEDVRELYLEAAREIIAELSLDSHTD